MLRRLMSGLCVLGLILTTGCCCHKHCCQPASCCSSCCSSPAANLDVSAGSPTYKVPQANYASFGR